MIINYWKKKKKNNFEFRQSDNIFVFFLNNTKKKKGLITLYLFNLAENALVRGCFSSDFFSSFMKKKRS